MADKELRITIKNLDKVVDWLKAKPAEAKSAIQKAIYSSAYTVEREAKIALTSGPNRAIDTGRLRASTTVQELSAVRATIYPTVNYAIFVHEGTRYMRARPFLAAAADKAGSMIRDIFEAALAEALK